MFRSEKDLKKAPPKRIARKGDEKEVTVVERAKQEREQRRLNRESATYALKIQKWWRGRKIYKRFHTSLREDIDKKLDDIQKLGKILLTTKSIEFVPPPLICLELTRKLAFFFSGSNQDSKRLILLCGYVLKPSLSQPDINKNIIYTIIPNDSKGYLLQKIMKLIFSIILPKTLQRSLICVIEDSQKTLLTTISYILGGGHAYKMTFPEDLRQIFQQIRSQFVDNKINNFDFFHSINQIYYNYSEKLFMNNYDDQISITVLNRPPKDCLGDHLFDLCLFLIEIDARMTSTRLQNFIREIFATPMALAQISHEATCRLCSWKHFESVLEHFSVPILALPPSPHSAFSSGQWLVGNICCIAPCLSVIRPNTELDYNNTYINNSDSMRKDPSTLLNSNFCSDDILQRYLDLCSTLLGRYPIPGVLSGRKGVLWTREGTQLTASSVPLTLTSQTLCLLDSSLLQDLVRRVLGPLAEVVNLSRLGSVDDRRAIQEAFSSSTENIARDSLQNPSNHDSWFGAKWAKKLMKSVSSALGNNNGSSAATSSSNASATRSSSGFSFSPFSTTKRPDSVTVSPEEVACEYESKASEFSLNLPLVASLCHLWDGLLPAAASAPIESVPWKALSALSFSPHTSSLLWSARLVLGGGEAACVQYVGRRYQASSRVLEKEAADGALSCLCACLKICLVVLEENEIYDYGRPLPLVHLLPLIRTLKMNLFEALRANPTVLQIDPNADPHSISSDPMVSQDRSLIMKQNQSNQRVFQLRCMSAVLANLHSRWVRRPFSSKELWEIEEANTAQMVRELREPSPLAKSILRSMPWAIELKKRLTLFREIMQAERISIQGDSANPSAERSRGTIIRIRRAQKMLLRDGMHALERVSANALKDRLVIRYIDETGQEEAGIDAGGLFKDFWTSLASAAFDPTLGLFALTPDQLMYPSPSAPALFGSECDKLFHFLGRVIGKAMYEDITVQPRFAHFFLSFMQGKYSFLNLVHDLATLDAELHKNLLFLKHYEGDIGDLCLTFAVTEDILGVQKEIELIPGGSRISVTSSNRHRYISAAANYYLHDRLKNQAQAFFSGLHEVVPSDLLSMFCAPELQILLSGSSSGVALEDLKQYTRYNGYFSHDVYMSRFWSVMSQLNEADRAAVVRFVTACERPPCLGWSALQPPFTIQRVDCSDDSRLPSASTCFNILKLPTYSSQNVLKEKLLLAVRDAGGFHLT